MGLFNVHCHQQNEKKNRSLLLKETKVYTLK